MSDTDTITAQVERLNLQPGDYVVVHLLDQPLDRETAERYRADLKRVLPDKVEAIILAQGVTLEKLSDEDKRRLCEDIDLMRRAGLITEEQARRTAG